MPCEAVAVVKVMLAEAELLLLTRSANLAAQALAQCLGGEVTPEGEVRWAGGYIRLGAGVVKVNAAGPEAARQASLALTEVAGALRQRLMVEFLQQRLGQYRVRHNTQPDRTVVVMFAFPRYRVRASVDSAGVLTLAVLDGERDGAARELRNIVQTLKGAGVGVDAGAVECHRHGDAPAPVSFTKGG